MRKYSVLHIEDNKGDAVLLETHLQGNPFAIYHIEWVQTLKEALEFLSHQQPHVIVLDLGLPDVTGLEGLEKLIQNHPKVPVVVHTGLDNIDIGLEAIAKGAQDFLQKDHVNPFLMSKTLSFVIERVKQQKQLLSQSKQLKKLSIAVDSSANTVVITDTKGNIEYVNKKFTEVTGYSAKEAIGNNPRVLKSGKQNKKFYQRLWQRISSGQTWIGYFQNRKKDGSIYWEKANISAVFNDEKQITHYIAIKEDVSALKAAEAENLVTTERISALFESAHTGIIYVNQEGFLETSNQKAIEILGFSQEQLADFKFLDEHWNARHIDGRPYAAEEFPAAMTLSTQQRISNAIMSVYQPVKKKNIWLSIDTIPLYEQGDDQLTGVYSVFRDITEEFESTRALQSLATKLRMAQSVGKIGYWEWQAEKDNYYWSDEVYTIFEEGQTPGEKTFEEYLKYVHPDDRKKVEETFNGSVAGEDPSSIDYRVILKNGKLKHLEDSWIFIPESPLQSKMVLGVVHDITKIKESENRLKEASNAANLGQWRYNVKSDRLWWSEKVYELFGLDPKIKDFSFQFFLDLVLKEDRAIVNTILEDSLINIGKHYTFECRINVKHELKYFEISGSSETDQSGNSYFISGIVKDVTKLKQSENRLIEASKAGQLGQWKFDLPTGNLWWSENTYEIYGVDPSIKELDSDFYWSLVHPEDIESVKADYEEAWTAGGQFSYQYRIIANKGIKHIQISGEIIYNEKNEPIGSSGIVKDITSLVESEQRLIEASSAAQLGHWSLDVDTERLWWSDQTYEIYGLSKEQEIDVESYWKTVHPDDTETAQAIYEKALSETGVIFGQYRIISAEEEKYVEVSGRFISDDNGNPVSATGIVKDITLLKQSELKIRENEEKLKSVLSSLNDMVFVLNEEGMYLEFYASKGGAAPLIPEEKIIGKFYQDILPPSVVSLIDAALKEVKATDETQEIEYALDESNGSHTFWNAKISRLLGPQTGYTVVVRDITEKKQNEINLRLSEERYKNHSENLPHILWTSDDTGKATYLNQQGLQFYGMTLEAFRKSSWDVLHPDSLKEAKQKWQRAIETKSVYVNTELHRDANEDYRWLKVQANPVVLEDILIGWVGVSTEVHQEVLANQENDQLLAELAKRVRESSTLFKMTQLVVEHPYDIETMLAKMIKVLPEGFCCPELTRISIEYQTKVYREQPLRYKNQEEFPILVDGNQVGKLTVALAAKKPNGEAMEFLKEEYLLVSSVVDNIGIAIQNKIAKDKLSANEEKYREVFKNLQEGYLLLDLEGQILESNPEAARILEGKKHNLRSSNFKDILDDETWPWLRFVETKKVKNQLVILQQFDSMHIKASVNSRIIFKQGEPWLIELNFKDVSRATKLNDLSKYSLKLYEASELGISDFIQTGIDLAVDLLESDAGFYHFVDEPAGKIQLIQWSRGTKKVCQVPNFLGMYDINDAGIWVECIKTREPVIHNDYISLKNKGGLPKGHFPINRDLEIPIMSSKGDIVGILGVGNKKYTYNKVDVEVLNSFANLFHSIVQKKQLEDEYLDTLKTFQQSQEAVKIGAWKYDIPTHKTWWSDSMFDIYGMPKSAGIPEENWLSLTHPDDREMQLKAFENSIATGTYECEYRILCPSGQIKHVYAKSVVNYDTNQVAIRHVGILQDITQAKKSMRLIEEKSIQFESMVDSLDGYVYRIYASGRVAYLSPTFEKMTGYSRDLYTQEYDSIKKQQAIASQHFHKDDRERALTMAMKSLENEEDYNITYRIVKPNKEVLWVSDNAKIIKDQFGIPLIQGYVYDITDRVKAEEHIMNAVMKASDGEKSRISKEIHDSLQQTLTIAALNLEFVKKDEDQLSDFVKRKYATGWEYLKRSMNDTRAIAHRLMPKAIEDFGLVPVLKDMVDDLNRSSGLEFEFLTNMEGKRIQIPLATNLYKLVQEAVNNILKHAKANYVTIQYMGLGDIIQLIIEDDGKGFVVDKLDLANSGFGLASMKSRATASGAEYILDSFPEHGTTIMVEIPYTKDIEYYE